MKTLLIVLSTLISLQTFAKVEDLGLLINENKRAQQGLAKQLQKQLKQNDKIAMRTRPDVRTITPDESNTFYVPSSKLTFESDKRQYRQSKKASRDRLAQEVKIND